MSSAKTLVIFPTYIINQMEATKSFSIYYDGVYVQNVTAHSGFEAIDKVYYLYIEKHPTLDRKKFSTKK